MSPFLLFGAAVRNVRHRLGGWLGLIFVAVNNHSAFVLIAVRNGRGAGCTSTSPPGDGQKSGTLQSMLIEHVDSMIYIFIINLNVE